MCQTCGLPSFTYDTIPLARTVFSTRLIKLHPARAFEADIVLDLILNNDSNFEFEALSWCWGRDKWNNVIRVRGDNGDRCLKVPENLEVALRRLRLVDRYRILWVDAICIDQVSTIEKSRQVPMMSEIYGKAHRVCVWLGEGDDVSKKAIRFIHNDLLDLKKFDQLCRDDEYGDKWIALIQFMEQPWFSRRWVIQEIALATQEAAIMVCGQDTIDWMTFSMAALLFHRALSGSLNQSRLSFSELENASFGLRDALRSDQADIIETSDLPIFDRPSTERILHLLIQPDRIRQPFKVDYSAPILEVYKQFMSFSVPRANPSRALDILCRPWAPDLPGEKFPSWIATLTNAAYKPVDRSALGRRLIRRNPDPLVGDADATIYTASRAIGPPKVRSFFKYWNSVDRSMFLQGFVLDTVSHLEFPSQLGHIPPEWPLLAGWKPKAGPPPEEFWRTLVADRGPDGRDPPSFYGPACETVFQEAMDDTLDTSMLINHGSSVISDFLKRVQAVIWNRRMMRTGNSWLGLAPKSAQEGDLVCILYGCSVPVVLRKIVKSQADLEKELEDEEIRKANIVAYIAKNLAAKARRKRLDKANERGNTPFTKDGDKPGKRVAESYPESSTKAETKRPHLSPTATDTTYQHETNRSGQAPGYYYHIEAFILV
ncbi:ankyrin and het domain protein [Fusarium beomiforme]|uniref:Ankyrin and het domain protein n=1 Tax=Fusarium beomiforme TaxID=44412 RepID=A0A9P5A9V1_9HYPO|nr:ankyrin and het domain protein [Fusarium beomiforme]